MSAQWSLLYRGEKETCGAHGEIDALDTKRTSPKRPFRN